MALAGDLGPVGGWLLQLPDCAKELVVQHLTNPQDRKDFRQACKATQQLVDACITSLKFGAVTPYKPWLAARFPRVHTLDVSYGGVHGSYGQDAMHDRICLTMRRGTWASVTTLHLDMVPARGAAVVAAACPAVRTCIIKDCFMQESEPNARAAVRHLCASCPALASLYVTQPMGDAELAGLAARSALEDLTVSFGDCGPAAWRHLMALVHLRSLKLLTFEGGLPPHGLAVDLRRLTCLTKLSISGDEQGGQTVWGRPLDAEYEESVASFYGSLQLPASLCIAAMERPPAQGLVLQHLTRLYLVSWRGDLDNAGVAVLSAACPALQELWVSVLLIEWEAQGAVAPLQHTTTLAVTRRCDVPLSGRFASLFPSLRSLSLCCTCQFQEGAEVLEGMSELAYLDVGKRVCHDVPTMHELAMSWYGDGLHMYRYELSTLGTLPKLRWLRCNAEPDHLVDFALHMTNLHTIEWVINPVDDLSLVDIPWAMNGSFTPAQLREARFTFRHSGQVNSQQESQRAALVSTVADRCAWWLRDAQGVSEVHWDAGSLHCAAMTDVRISLVAKNETITNLFVTQAVRSAEDGTAADFLSLDQVLNDSQNLCVHINGRPCLHPFTSRSPG